jgi:hypothetical protein
VKYMLLIYHNPANFQELPEDEHDAIMRDVDAIVAELTESGELIGGEGLADPSQTKTVRVRDGVPVVTDGPFLESKEHLVGYCMFEAETLDRALDIAKRWPDARHWAVEIRPLMVHEAGTEM